MSTTPYYTPNCMMWLEKFREANIPNTTEWHSEHIDDDGTTFQLDFTIYLNKWEFVSICDIADKGAEHNYMVYINNPNCPHGEEPKFGEEEQWVFGYYTSLKRAINKAISIAKRGKYPKPIEKW